MATASRVLVAWNGAPVVGGGVSVLHCTPGDEHALMSAFRTFFSTMAGAFPAGLQWTFPPAGVTINEDDGSVNGSWSDSSPLAALPATGPVTWANGVGLRIKWTTNFTFQGRQVVGSTFMVPLIISAYEGAGNILDGSITSFTTAATTLVAADVLRVYARPRAGVDGVSFPVFGTTVPDRVSWLRGRRT